MSVHSVQKANKKQDLRARHERARNAIDDARLGLSPDEDRELLEELAADITGYLGCLAEEQEG